MANPSPACQRSSRMRLTGIFAVLLLAATAGTGLPRGLSAASSGVRMTQCATGARACTSPIRR